MCMIIFACVSNLTHFVFFKRSCFIFGHIYCSETCGQTRRGVSRFRAEVSRVKLFRDGTVFIDRLELVCWLSVTSLSHWTASVYRHASPHLCKDFHRAAVAGGSESLTVLLMWQNKVINHDHSSEWCILLVITETFQYLYEPQTQIHVEMHNHSANDAAVKTLWVQWGRINQPTSLQFFCTLCKVLLCWQLF